MRAGQPLPPARVLSVLVASIVVMAVLAAAYFVGSAF